MKKRELLIYIIILLISLIICSNYIKTHYANDTFAIYNMGYSEYGIKNFLRDGRPFSCLLLIIAEKLNISIQILVFISTFIGILISCFSVMLLRKIIYKFKPTNNIMDEIIVTLISYCIIYNFMYIEILYFAEACIMSFGIFMAILAAYQFTLAPKHKIIKSFVFLLLAVFSYNGTVGVYIVSVILILMLQDNNLKKYFKDILLATILIILAIILNFIQIKLVGNYFNINQNRLSFDIINNIIYIIKNARKCFDRKYNTIISQRIIFILFNYSNRNLYMLS